MQMHDGDYFRWSYKEISRDQSFEPYWCKSRIALVTGEHLADTYWSTNSNATWSLQDARIELNLEFIANLANLAEIRTSSKWLYAPDDVVDLTHPNGGQCYIRKGAKEDTRTQIEALEEEKRGLLSRASFCQGRIDLLEKRLSETVRVQADTKMRELERQAAAEGR